MRKTSTYARKRAMRIKTNEDLYMDRARQLCSMDGVVAHSTPFSRNPIFNILKTPRPPSGITIDRIKQARAWLFGGENETK